MEAALPVRPERWTPSLRPAARVRSHRRHGDELRDVVGSAEPMERSVDPRCLVLATQSCAAPEGALARAGATPGAPVR
jgi:hypothetical protein